MRRLQTCLVGVLLLSFGVTYQMAAQEQSDGSTTPSRTLRPVVRGTQYAVSSMKLEATEAAVRILEAGGNAFDAAVAGQAVLALVNPESNGFGADAVVLVYNAREKKVHSIDAEGDGPEARDDRLVQQEQRRPDSEQRRSALSIAARRYRRVVHHARPLGHDDVRPGAGARDRRRGERISDW